MTTNATNPVGIIGSGTMGAGIAQTAAAAGWTVRLFDIEQSLVDLALESITKRFDRLVEKNRITEEAAEEYKNRIHGTTTIQELTDCDLIIEAIIEDFEIDKLFIFGNDKFIFLLPSKFDKSCKRVNSFKLVK